MAELKTIKATRKYLKGNFTRLATFLSDEQEIEKAPLSNLISRRESLIKNFEKYEQLNIRIVELQPESEFDSDLQLIENKYFQLLSHLDDIISKRNVSNAASQPSASRNTKLPVIQIQKFNGKYSEYVAFINLFKSLIDQDKGLDRIQKLHYLRSYLVDEPYDLVKNLPLTASSYHEALDLLESRYFNKFKITSEHVNALLDLKVVTRSTSIALREFVSNVKQSLSALKNLNIQVYTWDPIIISILTRKLDTYTGRAYQIERDETKEPSVVELLEFLEKRAMALENAGTSDAIPAKDSSYKIKSYPRAAVNVTTRSDQNGKQTQCHYCTNTDHRIFGCPKFKLLPISQRISFVSKNRLCKICLNAHTQKCRYHFKCALCKKSHNTLIHVDEQLQTATTLSVSTSADNPVTLMSGNSDNTNVLLPTARVKLIGKDNKIVLVKAILDSASQVSLVTTKAVDVLGLSPIQSDINIIGVTNTKNNAKYSLPVEIHSMVNPFKTTVNCHVVDRITCNLPQRKIDPASIRIPPHIKLADKDYNVPSEINMLIGADIFFQILLPPEAQTFQSAQICTQSQAATVRQATPTSQATAAAHQAAAPTSLECQAIQEQQATHTPYIINTLFGHIISGSITSNNVTADAVSLLCCECSDINNTLSKFWQTESVPQLLNETCSEHEIAENIFQSTVKLENKRFQVDLPLKVPLCEVNETLGNSFDLALYRFLNLEKKLHKNINLLSEYQKFINEYVELGHGHYIDMSTYDLNSQPVYFLPHHAVYNENSSTTRTRVVYDGSMKTNKRISLNDIMLNGPVVQNNLFDIMLLYRFGDYTFTADIKRMFRNILVNPEQTTLQNILWRDDPSEPIKCIRLDTVTYGLKSSSFLATRCLYELASRYESKWPLASFIVKHCTYVDDLVYADNDINTLLEAKNQLQEMLGMGSFVLHKWSSNHADILSDIPTDQQQFDSKILENEDYNMKALGLTINVKKDCFSIQSPEHFQNKSASKREILSYIAKIFDPLGFAGPVTVTAKSIMKKLHSEGLNWDDTPSQKLMSEWLQFSDSLAIMEPIHISRNIPNTDSALAVQLIGFADASSTTAYGCCIYLRVVELTGKAKLYLLCSRSRINPSAKPLTIPRLELNACLMLAQLMAKVKDTISKKITVNDVYLFSDSQIALAWLNTEPTKLKAYVSNRVKMVQSLTSRWHWLYVSTQNNPADIISRGVQPQALSSCSMWWSGPEFLQNREYVFENNKTDLHLPELPELKPVTENKVVLVTQAQNDVFKRLDKFSDINKMTRVLAYVLRFCHNLKSNNDKTKTTCLSSAELQRALYLIIKNEQSIHFQEEINLLKKNSNIKGSLKPLHPFLDQENLVRVGGRLENSNLPFSQKHPVILPKHSRVTEMIIESEHKKLLHANSKLLLSSLNQKYWLVNGIRQIKKIIHKCLICFRLKASASQQLMGSLPRQRVTASRPFQVVGIDFAGPLQIKNSRLRRAVISKGYICVFVCFCTKAIHLELTSDLTTDTFIACLKRFSARRGLPSEVFCDNAGTFKAARNKLVELYNLVNSQDHQTRVINHSSQHGIKFHFIPSYSPVFAGLAEAGVKSTKYHLKRVIQKSLFTYEQLNTILTQIECVLNSRPLMPVTSSSLADFSYITPGHFLIGAPLNSFPAQDLSEIPDNRLKFWESVEKIKQIFWKVWYKQYLNILQSRPKWRDDMPNVTVGTLVILKEPNSPPLYWPMARVVKIFPGKDAKVRAFQVTTPNGKIYTRSLSGICVLPIQDNV